MCFFAGVSVNKIDVERFTGARWGGGVFPNFEFLNAKAYPEIPLLAMDHPKEIRPYHWIFAPNWITTMQQVRDQRIWFANVILEEADLKKTYKPILETQRSIVVFSHFFEWRHEKKTKIKYKITLDSDEPMLMPGFCNVSMIDRREYRSAAIATMAAQHVMVHVHNTKLRQPVVVGMDEATQWLDTRQPFSHARNMVIEKNRSREFIATECG